MSKVVLLPVELVSLAMLIAVLVAYDDDSDVHIDDSDGESFRSRTL